MWKNLESAAVKCLFVFACCGCETAPGAAPGESEAAPVAPEPSPQANGVGQPANFPKAESIRGDRFWDAGMGFGISKPAQWVFLASDYERSARNTMAFGNKGLEERYRNRPRGPLVSLVKDQKLDANASSSVKVEVERLASLKGKTPRAIADFMLGQITAAVPSMRQRGPTREGVVAGRPAGNFEAEFVTEWATGTKTTAQTRVWLIPRGEQLFIVGMSTPLPKDPAIEADFAQILKSIEFAEPAPGGGTP